MTKDQQKEKAADDAGDDVADASDVEMYLPRVVPHQVSVAAILGIGYAAAWFLAGKETYRRLSSPSFFSHEFHLFSRPPLKK